MDFRLSDDQRALAEGIRSVLAGRLPLKHLRANEGAAVAIVDSIVVSNKTVFRKSG